MPELTPELTLELPWNRRKRYAKLELKEEDANMFVTNMPLGRFFDAVIQEISDKKQVTLAVNYIAGDLAGLAAGSALEIVPKSFADLIDMVSVGDISSRGAKDILKIMFKEGGDPKNIADKKGLLQKSDETELKKIVEKIIDENQKAAEEYKSGKESSVQFLIGQAMKATKGAANPTVLQKLFRELLG